MTSRPCEGVGVGLSAVPTVVTVVTVLEAPATAAVKQWLLVFTACLLYGCQPLLRSLDIKSPHLISHKNDEVGYICIPLEGN